MSTNSSDLATIRLAGGAQGFNWLPIFVALDRGLFAEHGLALDLQRLGSVDKATAAVREGTADLAITPPEGAISDYLAGGDLRIVAANSLRLPMSLVARSDMRDLGDVRGRRIGTSSMTEGTSIYTKMMLQEVGLQPDDYEFVLAGVHTGRWEALQRGDIDCAPQPAPWNFLAKREGYSLIGEVSDAIPEVVFAGVIADVTWANANKELLERFLGVLRAAHRIVNDEANDNDTLPTYQRITTPDEPELALRGFRYTRDLGMWPDDAKVTTSALDTSIDLMIRTGLAEESDRGRAIGVLDSSFAKAQ